MWKPYTIPSASQEDLTTAEAIAQLKAHNKDTSIAPWIFLENMTQFTENYCRDISSYLDETYISVFPELDQDQKRYLRQRLDRIIAATDKFYQYVIGGNYHA